jgi:hypothetical protein
MTDTQEEIKALPSSNQPLVYTLPGADLVDSLPYIDNHMMKQTDSGPKISKSMLKKIRKMIAHETKQLEKEGETDYLESLKVPNTPRIDSLIEEDTLKTLKDSVLGKREPQSLEDLGQLEDSERFKKLVTRVQQGSNQ